MKKIVTIQNICPNIYKNTAKNMAVCQKISNISWPKEKIKHNFHLEFCICQNQGYFTFLIDPTQVESKKSSQIQWPVPSINAEPVDIFLGEE